jgi:hypothetical protein
MAFAIWPWIDDTIDSLRAKSFTFLTQILDKSFLETENCKKVLIREA